MSNEIESKVRRRADKLGYAIGEKSTGNGQHEAVVFDPSTGAICARARDYFGLIPFLWKDRSNEGSAHMETEARNLAGPKGFFIGIDRGQKSVRSSAMAEEPFFESHNWCEVVKFLRAVPSVKNRFPSPSIEALAVEVAQERGYSIGQTPSGIAIHERQSRSAVSVAPFWREALSTVLGLPTLKQAAR
jgi:hypothetical protein